MKPTKSGPGRPMKPRTDAGLAAAIGVAGALNKLANIIDVQPSAIAQWKRIPEGRVAELAKKLKLPRHLLRPDLYEAPRRRAG